MSRTPSAPTASSDSDLPNECRGRVFRYSPRILTYALVVWSYSSEVRSRGWPTIRSSTIPGNSGHAPIEAGSEINFSNSLMASSTAARISALGGLGDELLMPQTLCREQLNHGYRNTVKTCCN